MQNKKNNFLVAGGLIVAGSFSRLIEHIPNFSAFEALALFGGAYLFSKAAAYLVPLVAMYASDLVLNNTIMRPFFADKEGFVFFDTYMIYNVIAMLAVVAVARVLLRKVTGLKVIGASLTASSLFFVITNFGSWLTLPYPKDLSGLVLAYEAALPFYQTSVVSSLLFTIILFGSYELYQWYLVQKETLAEVKDTGGR